LAKANRLREIMLERGYEPNITNYNAMIKAFGRCGELKQAFQLVDEMIDKKLRLTTETLNFLLQACASDKEYGFRHALLVWHKMYQLRLRPDIYSFNLMIRCCRDTELGDLIATKEVIDTILLRNPENYSEHKLTQIKDENVDSAYQMSSEVQIIPNLLTIKPHLGNLVDIKEVTKPEDRLLLLGGFNGFIKLMHDFDVKPDVKTYTELLEVIPNTLAAENNLLKNLKKADVKCDIDFFNVLMKKRSMRFDYEGAKEILSDMVRKANLKPDIVTYGILALGCKTREQAWELINEMNEKGIKMNMPILGAMVRQGCCTRNFRYIMDILRIIQKFNMKPNVKIFEMLDNFVKECNHFKKKDKQNTPTHFRENVKKFKVDLEKWKQEIGMKNVNFEEAKRILKERPWDQFKDVQAEGFENVKGTTLQKQNKYRNWVSRIKTKDVVLEDAKKNS
jgi:pentatricopeptide repeat domain-containing protein 1